MKRILPVLLGALGGAIGLPILMWSFRFIVYLMTSSPPNIGKIGLPEFLFASWTYTSGRLMFTDGFLLGGATTMLFLSGRTGRERLLSILCGIWTATHPIRFCVGIFQSYSATMPGKVIASFVSPYLPWLLWSLALFFFAVLSRPRKPLLP